MKFGQLIEYSNIFFIKNSVKNEAGIVPDHFLFFKKSFKLGKREWSAAWFYYISIVLKSAYKRNKLFKTLHYWSRDPEICSILIF